MPGSDAPGGSSNLRPQPPLAALSQQVASDPDIPTLGQYTPRRQPRPPFLGASTPSSATTQYNSTAVIIQCAAPTVSGEMMAPGIVDVDQMLTPFRCIPSALGIHDPISAHPTLSSPYQGPGGPADGRRIGDKLMVFAVLLAGALSWVGACSSSTTGRQRQSLDTRC